MRITGLCSLALAALAAVPTLADDCPPARVGCDQTLQLNFLGRHTTGLFDVGAAEISAFDPVSKRTFVVNGGTKSIDILDLSDPTQPTFVSSISMAPYGGGANSVAVRDGVVAVAVEASIKTDPGKAVFFDTNGRFISSVTVGALPDMLTFTPDGTRVLVANEGEPSDDYSIDPEGSVSIIDITGGVANLSDANVTTAGFANAANVDPQVEIHAPGATLATDLEPEYIAVSPDSQTAWVTLQESSALGILDIQSGAFTAVKSLGGFDHGRGTPHLVTASLLNPPSLGMTAAGQSIALGGMSGLFFDSIDAATGVIHFFAVTDRGPNPNPINVDGDPAIERPFALPDFQPRMMKLDFDPVAQTLTLAEQIFLKDTDGTPLSGIPNILGRGQGLAYTDEEPCDLFGQPIPLDPMGVDLEGLVRTPDNMWWMCDEYRPSILQFMADGRLIARYVPFGSNAFGAATGVEALPAVYAQRRANRGFEAIAQYDGIIYAFIQSPIDNPDLANDNNSKNSKTVRILKFDPATTTVLAEYIYRQEGGTSDKMGDAVALGKNRFLVVERDDGTGPNTKTKIFEIDLTDATDIALLPQSIVGPDGTLEMMTEAQLAENRIVPVTKKLVVDLAAIGYTNVADKVEGIAMLDPSRIAVINDNDFGLQGTFDQQTGLLTPNPNALGSTLGFITFTGQGFDPSDQDGGINIGSWPVIGTYRPDEVESFVANGQTYLVLANEGDVREWSGYNESVNGSTMNLDPNSFPDQTWLKANSRLGRLNIIKDQGDLDGDGDKDEIRAFGNRSFSVRDASGALVWDSAELFEQITAAVHPSFFNISSTNNNFDSRSRSKGPEPEGVTVGSLNDHTYAFVSLERIGGIMVFRLDDPAHPVFEQYINMRDFAQAPGANSGGDLAPEGLQFVPSSDSPTGTPLLIVANEVSGSVSVYSAEPICGIEPGDLEADCVVNASDLAILLGAWGPCPQRGECEADLDGDGDVDAADLAILLGNWG